MKGIAKNQLIQDSEHVATVVDLMGDLDKRVANFSGGMQRRLSLAIALLGAPDLLILDEPRSGLIQRSAKKFGGNSIKFGMPAAAF